MKALLLLLPLFISSCSYVHSFGQIGPHKLYKVQLGSIAAPGQTMVAMVDTNTGVVTFTAPIGGNGVIGSVVTSGGSVAMGYFIGKGLGESGDNTTINAAASVLSNPVLNNAPVINVPDPPPAAMIKRPPYKWGHNK